MKRYCGPSSSLSSQTSPSSAEPVGATERVGEGGVGSERHRIAEAVAVAHVDEPRLVEVDAQREVVVVVALAAVGVDHLGREHRDAVAQRSEQPGEEPVQLVAEAAAATVHDLVEDRVGLHRDRDAPDDVEVLERHGEEVRDLELGEGRGRLREAQAGQVRADVQRAVQTAAVAGESCSPKRARRTNCPTPGFATSSPPSTSVWPRRKTVSTAPVTSVPS